jgi:hypothetical protein
VPVGLRTSERRVGGSETQIRQLAELTERLEALGAQPFFQDRKRERDQLCADAGVMSLDEAQDLWEQGRFTTKAGAEQLDAITETFRLVGSDDELLDAVFTAARMASMHGDQLKAERRLVEMLEMFADHDCTDDLDWVETATEVADWLADKPDRLLSALPVLGPVVLLDELQGEGDLSSSVLFAAAVAADARKLETALGLLTTFEVLCGDAGIACDVATARFDVYRKAAPDLAVEYGLGLWSEGMQLELIALWLLADFVSTGQARDALEFGREALLALPDSEKLRAAVGRINRELEKL